MRLHAIGNALQLLLILGVNVRPKHLARRLAKKFPVALRLVRIEKLDGFERIGNLGSQQKPMLVADFRRRPFQVNVSPSALLEAVSLLQPRIGRSRTHLLRPRHRR